RRGLIEQQLHACNITSKWLDANPSTRNWAIIDGYGRILLHLKHYSKAEFQFRRVLGLHKGHVEARISLAWCLYHQGNPSEAFEELKHAKWWAKKFQSYPIDSILYHLGRHYLMENDLKRAISCFQEALVISPNNYSYYLELGRAYLIQGQFARALTAFQSAKDRLAENAGEEARQELEMLLETVR